MPPAVPPAKSPDWVTASGLQERFLEIVQSSFRTGALFAPEDTRTLHYKCGHNPVVVIRRSGAVAWLKPLRRRGSGTRRVFWPP